MSLCEVSPGLRMVPSKPSGPSPLLKFEAFMAYVHFREHALGRLCGGLKAGPHVDLCCRVGHDLISPVDFLEIFRDCLVDLVPLADELVLLDHRLYHRVA